jgi:hypothetical protein
MRMVASAVAAMLAAGLGAIWTPSLASPDISWSSDDVDIAPDVCRARAENAFTQGGWTNIHRSGQPAPATVAHKGPLVAVILCVGRNIGGDHAVALVFVAGGGDQGANERNWLQSYMAR